MLKCLLLHLIHRRLYILKPKNLILVTRNLKNTKRERLYIAQFLLEIGFTWLKPYIPHTWKVYKNNIRIVFVAQKDNKKWLIKADSDLSRGQLSANFNKIFSNKFDFVPPGYTLTNGTFLFDIKEFVNHYTFLEYKGIIRKKVNIYLQQAIFILKCFEEFKIIHCDLMSHNIVFDKGTGKMIVVDFDSWHSDLYPNESSKTPPEVFVYKKNGLVFYDDAYCFVDIFKKLGIPNLDDNKFFREIENMIGKNVFIR